MEHTWLMKYFAEFFGTIILVVLGNGSVANSYYVIPVVIAVTVKPMVGGS